MSQSPMIDSPPVLQKFREVAYTNSSLPPGFAKVLDDATSPINSLKYAKLNVSGVGPCRVYAFVIREPPAVHSRMPKDPNLVHDGLSDVIFSPQALEAEVASLPAVNGASVGISTSEPQDPTTAPAVMTVEGTNDTDEDQNMEEECDSEDEEGFTSLENSTTFVDPRFKPVDRIIKVKLPGTVLPKLDAEWHLGRVYDHILANKSVCEGVIPFVQSDEKVEKQMPKNGGMVIKREYLYTCCATQSLGPKGWKDHDECKKEIFGQENWQRHVKEIHLGCARGTSLKAWARAGKTTLYNKKKAIHKEGRRRKGTQF